ncbi:MAG: aminotransferase class I/II-fold pyridoxal phosphate-dependent enzyme, partial [Pseudobutyrivibrio sp.]|nr:aminotransferase class I/II-fold pyridoxal phosphate-dependent enzyme [Pseudobutyrivibrio sp.]
MSLEKILEDYSKSNMYPFHMPGHKRMLDGPYKIDMTEVDGVDDLHDPEAVIAEEQERLARIYGADKSFILVGGSTVGNLAAIYSSCSENDLILIQRNSHKSVYNGAILRHLKVGYINSKADENGIYRAATLEEIKSAVEKYGMPKAILLTSPTYEGYHCKLDEISKYCHEEGIILIVDQAHGAHLGFNDEFKE